MDNRLSRYKIWLDQSEFDIKGAIVSYEGGCYEWACYQSTQAVEKVLKAVVVFSGFRPPKTHKLGVLVGIANQANNAFRSISLDYRKIESYSFISRYPFIIPGKDKTPHEFITRNDAEICLKLAKDLVSSVKTFLTSNVLQDNRLNIEMGDYYYSKDKIQKRLDEVIKVLTNSNDIFVEKIVLFGSFSRLTLVPKTSTMDLLIIGRTNLDFLERVRYVRDVTHSGEPIIEPIVYLPEELDFLLNDEREGFLESALEEGKVVFEVR